MLRAAIAWPKLIICLIAASASASGSNSFSMSEKALPRNIISNGLNFSFSLGPALGVVGLLAKALSNFVGFLT